METINIIRNVNDDDLYWNNAIGWVDAGSADQFSDQEREELNLPLEGKWLSLPGRLPR